MATSIDYHTNLIHILNYYRYERGCQNGRVGNWDKCKFFMKFLPDGLVDLTLSNAKNSKLGHVTPYSDYGYFSHTFQLILDLETAVKFMDNAGENIKQVVWWYARKLNYFLEIPCVDGAEILAEVEIYDKEIKAKQELKDWLDKATPEEIKEHKRGIALEKAARIMGTKVKEKKVKSKEKGGDKVLEKQARKIAKMGGKASRYIVESEGIVYVATWAESGEHIEFRKQIQSQNLWECEQFPACIIKVK